MRTKIALMTGAVLLAAMPAAAHHSFAVFFDETRTVEIVGEVTDFSFRNPHGTITLAALDMEGQTAGETWRVETTAPVVLRRRGWERDSLKAGDLITVSGWPARDGANYLRMQRVLREDGSQVGQAFTAQDD